MQKKRGAKLFTLTHAVTVVVYITWAVITILPSSNTFLLDYRDYIFAGSFVALALTISFLLAQDRLAANQLLRKQFVDLEMLSKKNIAQEQEKQQLLAMQNERLEQQVEARTSQLNASLTELQMTQDQLIQKEKLASLGELTAGIAHEIQNPLNFVNNFSEVSAELVEELEEEQQKKERDVELETELLGNLKQNLSLITQHGKRASSIVKGMLEHSRSNTGEFEVIDLNALADEYLHLAYHGMKRNANDNVGLNAERFDVALITELDPNLGKVRAMPGELGRVLLNLYNNAFYAVQEKQKTAPESYRPAVTVITEKLKNQVKIHIVDNGTGIPQSVKAKIFQPFFTTKPTGEGTGLGLSLSYDIITKGHGGSLTMESTEGEGSEFTIQLPG